ncbi:MAG: MBL fold metallo-hydrolase [Methanobacteriaceae archaeon]|jgi:glyoxylase-like metal-dependent hydrolase (beta-lactamase superfamily II)|nr:MBL fold metallo-hydrolase [Candidatus Methanorudis spinitermitis]
MAKIISLGNIAKSYLIKEEDNSILVDTGIGFDKNSIYNSIKNENIALIFLTHGHVDHVANAEYLSKKLKVPIAMSKLDYPMIRENFEPKLHHYSFFGRILISTTKIMNKFNKLKRFNVDFFIEDEDSLEKYGIEGIDGIVHSLPGHTKGSMGLKVDNEKFIVGDAMMNHFSPSPASIFENREEMLKSVDFIKNSNVSIIYTGHGKSFKISDTV